MKSTHTYVELRVSAQAWSEIAELLSKAGYDHVFEPGGRIDMSGIAVYCDVEAEEAEATKVVRRDCDSLWHRFDTTEEKRFPNCQRCGSDHKELLFHLSKTTEGIVTAKWREFELALYIDEAIKNGCPEEFGRKLYWLNREKLMRNLGKRSDENLNSEITIDLSDNFWSYALKLATDKNRPPVVYFVRLISNKFSLHLGILAAAMTAKDALTIAEDWCKKYDPSSKFKKSLEIPDERLLSMLGHSPDIFLGEIPGW